MKCLVVAFEDGKVKNSEIEDCKSKTWSSDHVTIRYPTLNHMEDCVVPKDYPTTGEYKKLEFAPLPALAKGKEDANECTGVLEIPLTPTAGSPADCKCERVTLNGPYSPGPMVKCENCKDMRKAGDEGSCPVGTKLWAPRTREDWKTILSSVEPLRNPNWIVDITRPQNGCGGCTEAGMNSGAAEQASWVTSDNAPWWLSGHPEDDATQPSADYHANCYLELWPADGPQPLAGDENHVTFKAHDCNYHSKSYFCQLESVHLTPKPGSPLGCRCKKVELTGQYSPGILIKCIGCLDVYKSTQKNSCPTGSKIFAPRTRDDWKVFIDSATPLRAPNWIVDVTRPQDGCGGCTEHAMNSDTPAQATWTTSDHTAWFLKKEKFSASAYDAQHP